MKILDKYILKKILSTFFFVVLILCGPYPRGHHRRDRHYRKDG